MYREIFYRELYLDPIITGVIVQVVKVVLYSIVQHRFAFERFTQADGFPSLHAGVFSSLATCVGIKYGYSTAKKYPEKVKDLIDGYFISREEGFGQETKRSIMMGTYALSAGYYDAYYLKAAKVRTLIKEEYEKAFRKFDCLIGPTSPTTAFKIGEKIDNPLTMYLSDIYTVSINLAGLPAISIPCGFIKSENNFELPVGLQIIGNYFDEEKILQLANLYEKTTEWHLRKPEIS